MPWFCLLSFSFRFSTDADGFNLPGWITPAAAVVQAIVAVLLVIWIIKQTGIMREQKNLSKQLSDQSKEVERKINESRMRQDYDVIHKETHKFWEGLKATYKVRYLKSRKAEQTVFKPLDSLFEEEGFPPNFEPLMVTTLSQYVAEQECGWSELELWKFVEYLYSAKEFMLSETSSTGFKVLERMQNGFTSFWDKWSPHLDLHDYMDIDWKELVMLTWLELARSLEYSDEPMKKEFFVFAKAEWEKFKRYSA